MPKPPSPPGNKPNAIIGGDNLGDLTEDSVLADSGVLTISDKPAKEAHFVTQSATAGTYGTFSLDANGNWHYTLNNDSVQSLNTGQTATDTFTAKSIDGTTKTLTMTIHGADEVPPIDWLDADHTVMWDGIVGNETIPGTTELTYGVDSNRDGAIDETDELGLMFGDSNLNGFADDQDNAYLSVANARDALTQDSTNNPLMQLLQADINAWLDYLVEPSAPQPGTVDILDAQSWSAQFMRYNGGGGAENIFPILDYGAIQANPLAADSTAWTLGFDHNGDGMIDVNNDGVAETAETGPAPMPEYTGGGDIPAGIVITNYLASFHQDFHI